MISRNRLRVAGFASITQAAGYVTVSLAALMLPLRELAGEQATEALVKFHSVSALPLNVFAVSLILLSVLGLGAVVPTTADFLDGRRRGGVAFGRNLAVLALSVIAAYYTWFCVALPRLVSRYRAGDEATRLVLSLTDPRVPMNWVTWFMFGAMGLWVAIVGVAGIRGKKLPASFALACCVKTGGFWLALLGVATGSVSVTIVGTGIGVLVGGTLYHVWLGIIFLRTARTTSDESSAKEGVMATPVPTVV